MAHGEFVRASNAVPVDAKDVRRKRDDETRDGRIVGIQDPYLSLRNECMVERCFAISDRPMRGYAYRTVRGVKKDTDLAQQDSQLKNLDKSTANATLEMQKSKLK
jgi:hypothetical protein